MVPQTGLRSAGVMVLVVGTPGAGKRLIVAAAKNAYAGNRGVIFARRIVAGGEAPVHDDHEAISIAEFDDLKAGGAFAVSWRNHGVSCAIPASLGEEVDAGRVVVVDVSRSVVAALQSRFSRVHVVYVTNDATGRDERADLTRDTDVVERLAALWNKSSRARPSPVSVIVNTGGASEAVLEFQSVLAAYVSPNP